MSYPHNPSLEATGDAVRFANLSCMMEMPGLPLTARAPTPQLVTVIFKNK